MRIRMTVLVLALTLVNASSWAQGFPEGLRLEASGSYGELTADESKGLAELLDLGELIGSIDHAKGFEAGLGYTFGNRFGVIVRSGYLSGSAERRRTIFIVGTGAAEITEEWRISHIPLSIGADYRVAVGVIGAVVELATEVHFLDSSFHTDVSAPGRSGVDLTTDEESFMAGRGGFAIEWTPTTQFGAGVRTGYRVAEKAALSSFRLDLTGAYFGVYASFRPWAGP